MAYTELTVQYPTSSGIAPTYSAAAVAGNMFENSDGEAIVVFRNTNGSPRTVTVDTPGTVDGNPIDNKQIIIPATTGERVCMFPARTYNQLAGSANAGKVLFDYDAVTGLTVGVFHH